MMYSVVMMLALLASQTPSVAASSLDTLPKVEKHRGFKVNTATKLPYPVVDLQWTGPLSNGENITLTGTIEAVAAELLRIDPNRESAVSKRSASLEPRWPVRETCELPDGYGYAYVNAPWGVKPIEDGIRYLKQVGGGCWAGARTCSRISCSHNVGVYLCNDNDWDVAPWCDFLGYGHLQWINDNCERWAAYCCPSSLVEVNGGITTDADNYSVWLIESMTWC